MISLPHASLTYTVGRPLVMGILNVTPDSFSDGGSYFDPKRAVAHADDMVDAGADIIDVGPESTRPGADPVAAQEQISRAIPVIERIREAHPSLAISLDTRLLDVARAGLDAGADIINDVSALRDAPEIAPLAAERGAGLILMHMQGTPATMQAAPHYEDVLAEVSAFLESRAEIAEAAGVPRQHIILDPGIGFGKTVEHNLTLLSNLGHLVLLGYPILLGASRKRFLARLAAGGEEPDQRLGSSLACVAQAACCGVKIVRVHDVRATRQLIDTLAAIRGQTPC